MKIMYTVNVKNIKRLNVIYSMHTLTWHLIE